MSSRATTDEEVAFHALSAEDALRRLDASVRGLDDTEVARRQQLHGANVLPERKPPTLSAIVLHQFRSPLIYILLAAAAVALLLRDHVDAAFILIVVVLNAGLGTFQEWRAERSASALQRMLRVQARVRRGGSERMVPADELVPGDIVLLESGNNVPADVRMLRLTRLRIDESFLTGESVPVEKHTNVLDDHAVVSERANMAFAGSIVMAGRGEGVVMATGLRTEVGAIAEKVTTTPSVKPPLVVRMEAFAQQTSLVVLSASVLLALVALAQGMPYVEVFFLAVALAVSAIPEGLPVAMTVTLSIATTRMARRNVIVRRLTAVEGLGSCTYIASDKTGTLTVNRQTVRRLALPGGEELEVTGQGYAGEGAVIADDGRQPDGPLADAVRTLAEVGALCNEATLEASNGEWTHHGDAVDVALLALAHKVGLDPAALRRSVTMRGEIPFESERAYAAVLFERHGELALAVKGAFEIVEPRCTHMRTAGGVVAIEADRIQKQGAVLSVSGHRFLALAEGVIPPSSNAEPFDDEHVAGLTLVGLVGLIDPPRPEAGPAIAKCHAAGVTVAMVTGDHPSTALSIAKDLGIAAADEEVVTGAALAAAGEVDAAPFQDAVHRGRVFARVSPLQKLQIVEALKHQGHFVAVTGDGVNDAPALRAANIGVAMGSGSDVTKDTASLIVTDDNFASIEAGIEEGRFAYDNIRKVTYLLISTGAAEVVLFMLALLTQLPLPLLPVQLLWLNLVTNGIQDVALAFEGGEPGAMNRPPRKPSERMFNRLMVWQTSVAGLTMGLLAFASWWILLGMGVVESDARNRVLLLMVLLQNFHVFNARSEYTSAFRVPLSRNYVLVFGVLAAQGIHLLAMHVPLMQRVLHVGPVAFWEWGVPFAQASIIVVGMEVFKWAWRRKTVGVEGGRR